VTRGAEYLADALAAQVAGSASVVALHANLLMRSTVELAVQQAANANATDALDPIRVALHGVPERERERRRRAARLEEARLDSSHPPTALRIALIEGRPAAAPRVVLNQAGARRIDAELEPLADRVSREVLDAYRASLYEG
jgi:Zn-dependent protease with chaperone function